MRAALAVISSCVALLAACTGGGGSASSKPTQTATATAWFSSAEAAVKHDCRAYWVGEFVQNTHQTQIQWETKSQYASGDGIVAKLARSGKGFRVITLAGTPTANLLCEPSAFAARRAP
jgi:hypothetical protein